MLRSDDVAHRIRRVVEAQDVVAMGDFMRATGLSRQGVHHHLRKLLAIGEIERLGSSRGRGVRYRRVYLDRRVVALADAAEHLVWSTIARDLPHLSDLRAAAFRVHEYVFGEMLNNAIDHSTSDVAVVATGKSEGVTWFRVADEGVGAFRKIREAAGLPRLIDAVGELQKGRFTTDPANHSGEGIFFSSRAVDRFRIEANGLSWEVQSEPADNMVVESPVNQGTTVLWWLKDSTDRDLSTVFTAFTDDDGRFSRTRVALSSATAEGGFLSRSHARRLMDRLDQFAVIELDFSNIAGIGQGFADEVFRVWLSRHPDSTVVPTGMTDSVRFMVERAIALREEQQAE